VLEELLDIVDEDTPRLANRLPPWALIFARAVSMAVNWRWRVCCCWARLTFMSLMRFVRLWTSALVLSDSL
jgi:hypothetical protein